MEQTPQPSLKKILFADSSTLIVAILPLAAWFLAAMLAVMWFQASAEGKDTARLANGMSTNLLLAVAGTLFAVLFIMLRVRMYQRFFAQGVEARGIVTFVFSWRGRTSIHYTYDYMGLSYKGKASASALSARGLRKGMDVALLLDYQEPKRSLIRQFYA